MLTKRRTSSLQWQMRGCSTHLRILPLYKLSRVCCSILGSRWMLWALSPERLVGRGRQSLEQRIDQGCHSWWRQRRRHAQRESTRGSWRDPPSHCFSNNDNSPFQSLTLQITFQTPPPMIGLKQGNQTFNRDPVELLCCKTCLRFLRIWNYLTTTFSLRRQHLSKLFFWLGPINRWFSRRFFNHFSNLKRHHSKHSFWDTFWSDRTIDA